MFGGGSKIRSFWSLLSLIFLSVSSGLTIMGVITESKSTSPDSYWALPYVIPSAIMNVLCVVLLIYLISTIKGKSNIYKLVVSFLLLAGLASEIYMTMLLNMTHVGEQAATWIIIILNWLFRTFYVLEFVQEEWSPLFPPAKDIAKAVSGPSSSSSTSSSSASSGTPDVKKELRKRLNEYIDKLKQTLRDRDVKDAAGNAVTVVGSTRNDAEKFISGLADPKLGDLSDAKKLLKLSDGRDASAVLAGGRR